MSFNQLYIKIKNLYFKKIKDFKKFNTLIIDAEGDEQYYIKNIKYLKNILINIGFNDKILSIPYTDYVKTLNIDIIKID